MTIKASRPAAWIIAAGLFACMGAPSFAAEGSVWPSVTAGAAPAAQPAADSQQAQPTGVAAPQTQDQQAQTATDATAQQPNTVERSLTADQRPADATTPAETADANTAQAASAGDQGSGWDKASIVGKIFIAAGTLLTLGSAARMFMI
jgi:hypothetical protein